MPLNPHIDSLRVKKLFSCQLPAAANTLCWLHTTSTHHITAARIDAAAHHG